MMNRVNCPECGYIMDGASVRCPKCRFPIGKFSESGNAEGGAIVITQEEFSALKSEMTGVRPWYTEIKDKKLVRKIIPIIIVTIILCVAAAAVVLFADSGRRGAEPQVTEMKLGRNMKLNGINAIRVKTDETAPFAAVFRDTRNDKLMYSGIMRKDDNRTSKSLSGRSVTYKLSGFIIKTGYTDNGPLFFIVFSASYGSITFSG